MSNFSIIFIALIIGFTSMSVIGAAYMAADVANSACAVAIEKEQPTKKIEQLSNQEFYTEFDIVYVQSTDTGWEVSTEQYGTLFVEMDYNQAISMASVLTWVGYQCDYTCKEEMVGKALSEHYQLMYH